MVDISNLSNYDFTLKQKKQLNRKNPLLTHTLMNDLNLGAQ